MCPKLSYFMQTFIQRQDELQSCHFIITPSIDYFNEIVSIDYFSEILSIDYFNEIIVISQYSNTSFSCRHLLILSYKENA